MFDLSSEEITSKPLTRVLVILSVPLLGQNLVEVASLVIDLFWIGRLSEGAVSAVGLAFPLVSLLLLACIGVPYIGTMILVSQRTGAEDEKGAQRATFNGAVLGAILGLVFGIGAYLSAPQLVEFIMITQPNPPSEVADLTVAYFRIIALGMCIAAVSDALEAAFIARGDSRAALNISVATVGMIMIADPVLIFGLGPVPALGVEGAALATVLGYATGLGLAAYYAATGRSGGILSRDAFDLQVDLFRELFDNGFSPAAQMANRRVADVLIVLVVFAAGGAPALAAYLVGTRIFSIASVPADTVQTATQTVVGQNLGADQPGRASMTAWLSALLICTLLALAALGQWMLAEPITRAFAPELDGAAFELAVDFLQILALSYPAFGVLYALQGGFNGASRGEVSFRASVVHYWVLQLPLAVGAGLYMGGGATAVFWAITLSNVLTGVGLAVYYYYVQQSGMFRTAAEEAGAAV